MGAACMHAHTYIRIHACASGVSTRRRASYLSSVCAINSRVYSVLHASRSHSSVKLAMICTVHGNYNYGDMCTSQYKCNISNKHGYSRS